VSKRVLLVPDGMADHAQQALGGRTPLEAADTPAMDALARQGIVGRVRTVPAGMAAGSDVANLSVLGYDPEAVYGGRSPLEAASIGVELEPGDVAYRCNFVTIVDGVMKDNTAGHIDSAEARRLIAALQDALGDERFEFHAGVSYRNLLVWRGGELVTCTPPHDILDHPVAPHLPRSSTGGAGAVLRSLGERAREVVGRLRPDTEIWLWGEGRRPSMPTFGELYDVTGAVVAAVDLVRGIGRYAGLEVLDVPGATGDLHTDYGAKGRAACRALREHDLVWVHVEAPDEASHMGSLDEKIRAIERVDHEVLSPLLEAAERPLILVLPDHLTPLATRTHAADPVPFVIGAPRGVLGGGASAFSEPAAAGTGLTVGTGPELMRLFLQASG
jgi:2,3-bisphosphoglycerate-independent phosphoglycerate mutase